MTTTQFLLAKAKPLQIQLLVNEKLPKELLHAAVGQLLGDAHADKSSPTSNTRLSWSFGTAYKEYAYFISNLFDSYVSKGVYTVNAVAKKGGDSYVNNRLKTATLPIFNMLHDMFYKLDPVTGKYIKIVPLEINELMSPITLAHLIMTDGGYHKKHNMVRIFTYNFTLNDCNRLAQSITDLGIITKVVYDRKGKDGKDQYVLKIGALQIEALRKMVIPHMEKSMYYRVGFPIQIPCLVFYIMSKRAPMRNHRKLDELQGNLYN